MTQAWLSLRALTRIACSAFVAFGVGHAAQAGSVSPDETARCAAFVAGEAERPLYPPPWGEYHQAAETIVRLSVAGTRFAIPGDYFRHPPYGCDMPESGFLLRVIIHDLAPYASNIERGRHSYDTMNILLSTRPSVSSWSGEPIYYMRNLLKGVEAESFHVRVESSTAWDGIYHAEHDSRTDVYFDLDDAGEPVLVIRCSRFRKFSDGSGTFPRCGMNYPRDGAFVRLSFSREHLPRWREIKAEAEGLLNSFATNHTP